jgi:hypothetical protein
MAKAVFLNASPYTIAVNLNESLSNSNIDPMSDPTSADPPTLTVYGAPYVIAGQSSPDVFGGNGVDNQLIVFAPDRGPTELWHLKSTVSTALDLYFYMFDDQLFGVDQTGSSANIAIQRGSIGELRRFMERLLAVPGAYPKLP